MSLCAVAIFSCIIFVIVAVRHQSKKLAMMGQDDISKTHEADDQMYAPDCELIPLEKQVLCSYRYTPSHRLACNGITQK